MMLVTSCFQLVSNNKIRRKRSTKTTRIIYSVTMNWYRNLIVACFCKNSLLQELQSFVTNANSFNAVYLQFLK